jgi:hypothetical protein
LLPQPGRAISEWESKSTRTTRFAGSGFSSDCENTEKEERQAMPMNPPHPSGEEPGAQESAGLPSIPEGVEVGALEPEAQESAGLPSIPEGVEAGALEPGTQESARLPSIPEGVEVGALESAELPSIPEGVEAEAQEQGS